MFWLGGGLVTTGFWTGFCCWVGPLFTLVPFVPLVPLVPLFYAFQASSKLKLNFGLLGDVFWGTVLPCETVFCLFMFVLGWLFPVPNSNYLLVISPFLGGYYTFLSPTFPPNILNIAFLLGEEFIYFYCFELLLAFVFVEEDDYCLLRLPDWPPFF